MNIYEVVLLKTSTEATKKWFAENRYMGLSFPQSGTFRVAKFTNGETALTTSPVANMPALLAARAAGDTEYRIITRNSVIVVRRVPPEKMPMHLVEAQEKYQMIYYGRDGYHQYTCRFNRSISREEFLDWCKQDKRFRQYRAEIDAFEQEKPHAWYENYVDIFGSGNTWVFKHVTPSTD